MPGDTIVLPHWRRLVALSELRSRLLHAKFHQCFIWLESNKSLADFMHVDDYLSTYSGSKKRNVFTTEWAAKVRFNQVWYELAQFCNSLSKYKFSKKGEQRGHYYTIRFTSEGVEVFNDMKALIQKEMPYKNSVGFVDYDFLALKMWRIFSYKKLSEKRKM